MDDDRLDDLIEWFAEADGFSQGRKAPHKWVLQAEQELRIQAATIARQQVMLDRALEDIGEKMVEIGRLRDALGYIADASDLYEPCGWAVHRARAAINTPETAPPE